MLAEDGAGRLSARLPHPAGPQAAIPRDPRGGSVTVPSAGILTYINAPYAQITCLHSMGYSYRVMFTLKEGSFISVHITLFV